MEAEATGEDAPAIPAEEALGVRQHTQSRANPRLSPATLSSSEGRFAMVALTQDQIQKLLSLIESLKPGYHKLSGKNTWMFDNGASYHMTGDLNSMQDIKQIFPISNGMPNRELTFASKEGTVTLDKRIKLTKVLYVPSLKCKLISIARLCKELNCSVTFFDDFCVLQDCTLRTPIGAGQQRGGVYFFKDGSLEARQINAINSMDLWHKRLRHPSHEILSLLLVV